MDVADEFKQRQRAMWAAGDFPTIAPLIQEASDLVIDRLGIEPGQDVLDVATGSGNAAIAPAERGARVVGLDQVPELLEAARVRAAEAGVEVEWVEGDAEALPFDGASFDRVSSVFGVMFAPRHRQTAGELVRVTRPGGRIGVTGWTAEGLNGRMFKTVASHLPPPPPELKPPVMWGDEQYVGELFSDPGLELTFERHTMRVEWESLEEWIEHCERNLGPVVLAKAALEPDGRWQAARDDLAALYDSFNEAEDGSLDAPAEYLVTLVDVGTAG
jgi:SAM-dependent methyltransferase